jgi:hypothetical protein
MSWRPFSSKRDNSRLPRRRLPAYLMLSRQRRRALFQALDAVQFLTNRLFTGPPARHEHTVVAKIFPSGLSRA